jgi:hypothetical protein
MYIYTYIDDAFHVPGYYQRMKVCLLDFSFSNLFNLCIKNNKRKYLVPYARGCRGRIVYLDSLTRLDLLAKVINGQGLLGAYEAGFKKS